MRHEMQRRSPNTRGRRLRRPFRSGPDAAGKFLDQDRVAASTVADERRSDTAEFPTIGEFGVYVNSWFLNDPARAVLLVSERSPMIAVVENVSRHWRPAAMLHER
jgi:hypothetical protein